MCGVCRIDSDGLVLCPGCFDRLSAEGALPSARVSYRDYGRLAESLALLALMPIFAGLVAGPAAVYYGNKGLRQKRELGETEGRTGVWVAIILGGLATVSWLLIVGSMFRGV